jgi:hypothetical protein
MFRVIRRLIVRRRLRREASPAAGPVPASAKRPPASTSTPAFFSSDKIELDGVSFPVVRTVADFVAASASLDRIALRLRNDQYKDQMKDIIRQFEKYPPSSPENRALKAAPLVCAGCNWEFPGSYKLALIGFSQHVTSVSGATPGFTEFGSTGTCTKCGSAESFVIYERYDPSSISQADVDAIRRYWKHRAHQWVLETGSSWKFCEACSSDFDARIQSFLIGSRLHCESCTDRDLDDGLNKLRRDPYYFGATELRKARAFATLEPQTA